MRALACMQRALSLVHAAVTATLTRWGVLSTLDKNYDPKSLLTDPAMTVLERESLHVRLVSQYMYPGAVQILLAM